VPSGPAAADESPWGSDGQQPQSAQQQQQEQCHAVVMHDNEDVCISPAPAASSPLLHSSPIPVPAAVAASSSSSLRCRAPIQVDFRNLTAVLEEKDWLGRRRGREHTIVQRISGRFAPGKLVGILGGSGSGQWRSQTP
jgi:ABC-type glutathione transport system ATPase component